MGTNIIGTATDGTIIPSSDHNSIKEALGENLVPRNTDGEPTDNGGSLGDETYNWKRARVTTGYFQAGMIIPWHDFNNAIDLPQGWFPCNGSVINETNYNSLHGAGAWDTFIGTSPLDGKFSPNMSDRYLVGAAATSQDGSVAITAVGNTDHEITTSNHSHTVNSHNHQWYEPSGNVAIDDQTYDSGGSLQDVVRTAAGKNSGVDGVDVQNLSTTLRDEAYTSNASPGTSSNGGETIDAQPESIEVQYIIRII